MECQNHKDCNHRLQKIIKKVKKEITKIDLFLQDCDNKHIYYDPDKDEKKKIINAIKAKSHTNCLLIEELNTHRREIKNLFDIYIKLMQKNEKLKSLRKNQLEQIKSIQCYLKNELLPMTNINEEKSSDLDTFKILTQQNNEFEKTFQNITSEYSTLSEQYAEYIKSFNERLNRMAEENDRDKMLFGLITKYIQKAFEIRVKIVSKPINFMDYAFSESENEFNEETLCFCKEELTKQKKH